MPKELPDDRVILAGAAALPRTMQPQIAAINELVDTSHQNLTELHATTEKLQATRQQLVQSESALSELKLRQAEADKRVQEQTVQAVKLGSDLRLAQVQLAQSVTDIASLHKTVADLQDRLKAAGGPSASRAIHDLVGDLRADAANLFAKPFRAADSPTAPGVVIDGLEFEIRGGLVIGDKVGLRSFAADQPDPAAASIVRFSLRPEMRIEVPDDGKT